MSVGETLPRCSYWELFLWILRRRSRFRVSGYSMTPLLQPGEEILVDPQAYRHHSPKLGDIVVARHPERHDLQLVKWIGAVRRDGQCFLIGNNLTESTDSRTFGWVSSDCLLGRVTSRFQ
ncbi:nickel-type superoxide dismutase maturation protease [Geitlerinema sp. PCC 9228]|uniref:nickel-type superoxide dismutase maturation protease n=1 Tax=Geitlerinema sp. PCC 9228 TaxID=111611 RepID=UPI0008F99CDB|nr:nickel-type superoxide dismutase maturation protease [Geitlerinema sp. PCC 9228]